jgi:hypothetical protein
MGRHSGARRSREPETHELLSLPDKAKGLLEEIAMMSRGDDDLRSWGPGSLLRSAPE